MNDAGQQLAGHFIHIGDHEQEALRGGEGSGKGARRQRAVDRTGHAAFALHLDHHSSVSSAMTLEGVMG